MNPRRLGLAGAALALVLDQVTKQAALDLFSPAARVEVLPVLDFTLAWNRGVSFGFFGSGGVPPWTFILISIGIVGFLAVLMWREASQFGALGYGLIVGGALGNVVDRAIYGAVVDFILAHWGEWSFPVFNVADTAITLGVVLILIDSLWPRGSSTTS